MPGLDELEPVRQDPKPYRTTQRRNERCAATKRRHRTGGSRSGYEIRLA